MTLEQIFQAISTNPNGLLLFLLAIPLATFLVNIWQDPQIHPQQSLARYAYAVLAYLACIPGIFAVTLNLYLFLFERQSIWKLDLIIQALPIITMAITLVLIKWKMPFEYVPQLERLSGFMTIITALIGILWFVDRLRLYAVTYIPFQYIIIGFIIVLVAIRYGWKKLF